MRTLTAPTLRHAGACVSCVIIGLKCSVPLEGTEFSGGSVTGPLLTVHGVSLVLFLVSAVVIFGSRGGATTSLLSLVSCPCHCIFTSLFRVCSGECFLAHPSEGGGTPQRRV